MAEDSMGSAGAPHCLAIEAAPRDAVEFIDLSAASFVGAVR
jgi:hypothetical protein